MFWEGGFLRFTSLCFPCFSRTGPRAASCVAPVYASPRHAGSPRCRQVGTAEAGVCVQRGCGNARPTPASRHVVLVCLTVGQTPVAHSRPAPRCKLPHWSSMTSHWGEGGERRGGVGTRTRHSANQLQSLHQYPPTAAARWPRPPPTVVHAARRPHPHAPRSSRPLLLRRPTTRPTRPPASSVWKPACSRCGNRTRMVQPRRRLRRLC